jgi:hypothetical protein
MNNDETRRENRFIWATLFALMLGTALAMYYFGGRAIRFW